MVQEPTPSPAPLPLPAQVETWLDDQYCITPYSQCPGMLRYNQLAQDAPPPPPPSAEAGCLPQTLANSSTFYCDDSRSA